MIGREKSMEILHQAMGASDADQLEVRISGQGLSLTRFANSAIHQNLTRENASLHVRAVLGKKIGTASTNNTDPESVQQAVRKAEKLAGLQEDNEDFESLPEPGHVGEICNYYPLTAEYSPKQRAEDVRAIVARADKEGFSAFGSHSTVVEELAVMNSLGVEAYDCSTYGYLRTVIEGESGTGYADSLDRDVTRINPQAVAEEAVSRTARAQNPRRLPPGEYEAVFLPYAVADIVRFLGYLGFRARLVQQGRSFMAGRFGDQITGKKVTIWDDGLDGRTLNAPFDAEGVSKQRVNLITDGVAEGVVHDSFTAHKEGMQSTGHARDRRGMTMDMPANMIMKPGSSSTDELIANTERGLLVTRFHYTHCPEPREVIMTGTTRDGIFYIEDGKIRYPVRNMRLTDSVLRMFGHISGLSSETKLQRDWWSTFTSLLPAVHVKSSRWSAATEF